jgi:hypothetical protein
MDFLALLLQTIRRRKRALPSPRGRQHQGKPYDLRQKIKRITPSESDG